jgi:hypothetical protein
MTPYPECERDWSLLEATQESLREHMTEIQRLKQRQWVGLTDEEINRRKQVDPIRVRIMQEAYDLADRDDSEGYNSVKVMCSEVLGMIDRLLDERQWQGLTDEEIKEIIGPWGDTPIKGYTRKLFDQIEAKLKEKNG